MPNEHEYKWNVEDLTDRDVSAAIRYLDPNRREETLGDTEVTVRILCVSFLALMLVAVAFLWLYLRIS